MSAVALASASRGQRCSIQADAGFLRSSPIPAPTGLAVEGSDLSVASRDGGALGGEVEGQPGREGGLQWREADPEQGVQEKQPSSGLTGQPLAASW